MITFKEKVLEVVKKIRKGKVKTYKEVAKLVGRSKAYRVVANILAKNRDFRIPCHRVIKNDYRVGGYYGSFKNSWLKVALLLKEGVIIVMPTDTIYGICGTALKKDVVEKIYRLRKRSLRKPMIILISSLEELKIFGIKPNKEEFKILKKLWPGEISVILKIKDRKKITKFTYLHRGSKTLAFRLPKPKWLIDILKISGPLVAPSANWESYPPASKLSEAKKYFGKKVVYWIEKRSGKKPSTLIKLEDKKIEILRKGTSFRKVKALFSNK